MTPRIDPESIDLAELTTQLSAAVQRPLEGSVEGRTQLRDAALRLLGCSQLEAEQLIDTMVSRGFLRPERRDDGLTVWRLQVA